MYVHKNPTTNQVFYVGIGSRKDRATFFRNRNIRWKNYVAKHGEPIVEIVAYFKTEAEACEAEFLEIQKYGRRGYDKGGVLTNIKQGGTYHSGYRHTPEAKAKISAGLRGRPASEKAIRFLKEDNPSRRPEVREKIRQSKLGKKRDAETVRKMSENASSRRPEVKAKISDALKGKVGALHARSKSVGQYLDGKPVAVHESILQAAAATGGDFRLISAVANGKRKRHLGYEWKFC